MSDPDFPLEHEWAIYYERSANKDSSSHKSLDAEAWVSSHSPVGTFASVSKFWSFWNNLVSPSRMPVDGTFSCFQSHIQPAWEDPVNKDGGEVRLFFHKQSIAVIDTVWISLLLAAVGETLDTGNDFVVCGLTVSRKKFKSKISVWIDSCDPAARAALERAIRVTVGGALLDEMGVALDWTGHQQLLDREQSKDMLPPQQQPSRGKRPSSRGGGGGGGGGGKLDRPPSMNFLGSH